MNFRAPAEPLWKRFVLPLVMLVAVFLTYLPPGFADPNTALRGIDFENLHVRRIRFAREALKNGDLPAWYPREFLGTPFRANIQNFPFIPTRWPLLLMDPMHAYALGVLLNACLAALFAYLFLREIGLGTIAAAIAGWTFACSGEFAVRVLAGHLVSLEGYPSLPLLLWLGERAIQPRAMSGRFNWRLIALGVAACCIALTPHPQFPAYSFMVGAAYILYRTWPRPKRALLPLAALGAGVGMAAFSLLPMFMLTGRSTRVLDLAAPINDVPFAFARLLAFVLPWQQGWSQVIPREPFKSFTVGPNEAYFWDTVCYTGLLPVACFVAIAWLIVRKHIAVKPVAFILLAGVIALVTAMPFIAEPLDAVPGTYFRSPARQIYVTVFALAVAVGAATQLFLSWVSNVKRPRRAAWMLFGSAALALHLFDLTRHTRFFVTSTDVLPPDENLERAIREDAGDGRVAIDYVVRMPVNRTVDDVGFFDSIILARPYVGLLALEDANPRLNVQDANGSTFRARTLATFAARLVLTTQSRPDLPSQSAPGTLGVYRVPDSAPRAAFFGDGKIARFSDDLIDKRLRDQRYDPRSAMMLAIDSPVLTNVSPTTAPLAPAVVQYQRPGPDVIEVRVETDEPGYLRIIESWDPGWHATIDDEPASVIPADGMFISVPVPRGGHVVRLTYSTPGAIPGIIVSMLCSVILAASAHRAVAKRLDITSA